MGYAISWLAVRGTSESDVLAALGLEKTEHVEKGGVPEGEWCSARLGQWTLVWSDSFEPARFTKAVPKLKGEMVICSVEEHVMFISAAAFVDGLLSWRIIHDAQQGANHLSVEGNPPAAFARIQAEEFARAKEADDVDYVFEIPARTAQEVVGFRHDAKSTAAFENLQVISKPKPWWKFW